MENCNPGPGSSGNEFCQMSRREFISTSGLAAVGVGICLTPANGAAPQGPFSDLPLELTINGEKHRLTLDPRVTLLDLLRDKLGLTGSKKGCDHGQCGACTVLANGRRINSCLSLALSHEGDQIITIEGLAANGELHPAQQAFIQHDGLQCGYCTPGQI